jgi:hypothetical protein
LYLLRRTLPWKLLDATNRHQKYQRICQVEQNTSLEDLCSALPDEFLAYFRDTRGRPFAGAPNYASYRTALRKLFLNCRFAYDHGRDWTSGLQGRFSAAPSG